MKQNKKQQNFPFSAVIGQDNFKLALILNLIDPLIGGILAVGDKGTGKTTLIRSLSNLMGDYQKYPFVNLPIGVSEDRLIGSVDLEQLINTKKEVVNLGLMAQAHQGILYVDEVNLLQDYLTDVLLDAAASGNYYLEREGLSRTFDSRFCLIGSMNPEEGSLRPQFKDRFGLSVTVTTPTDPVIRQKIVKQRFKFDNNPTEFIANYKEKDVVIYKQIIAAKNILTSVKVTDWIIEYCSRLAIAHHVEGLRADILLVKTARAFAAFNKSFDIKISDVDTIAKFVLDHRSTKSPSNPNKSLENQTQQPSEAPSKKSFPTEEKIGVLIPQNTFHKLKEKTTNTFQEGASSIHNPNSKLLVLDTKKTVSQYVATDKFELKTKRKATFLKQHHIFLIDSSGSMLKDQIIAYAKGSVCKIAVANKKQNTQFSIISLFDGEAQLITKQTTLLQEVETYLTTLKTGGKTNLTAGFRQVKGLCAAIDSVHNLHIITDGKLNTGDTVEDVVLAFKTYCKGIHKTHLIDAEKGMVRIGQARELADRIAATYEHLISDIF
ncbi:AAA family ATPase [Aquimarina sp. W85]|uniref:AAA family ATPase n=1 Tax=Aquimarina rhodophyticola TaxID=3342246 RepID=UPI00366C536C